MIYWHLREFAELGVRTGCSDTYDFLSSEEQRRLAELRFPKRRADWLLGRWTAKQLLSGTIARATGAEVGLDQVTIKNAPSGAPVAQFETRTDLASKAVSLSISHSHGRALCALSVDKDMVVGADIELVERRSPSFAEDYFTASELAGLKDAPCGERELLTTAIWSAKEAVLKAMFLGLRVDTRQVNCQWDAAPTADNWRPFKATFSDQQGPEQRLYGWWRTAGPFVMTLASRGGAAAARQVSAPLEKSA